MNPFATYRDALDYAIKDAKRVQVEFGVSQAGDHYYVHQLASHFFGHREDMKPLSIVRVNGLVVNVKGSEGKA